MELPYLSPVVPGIGPSAGRRGRRGAARRAVSVLSVLLLVLGVLLLAYPTATDVSGALRQQRLDAALAAPVAYDDYRPEKAAVGDGLTRLRIPTLDVDVVVVVGTTRKALRAGAGHYADTAFPGEEGNVAIAGHRTTYGRPFHRLDEVSPGDLLELVTPVAVHTYRASAPFDGHANPWVVAPTEVSVIGQVQGQRLLTLTTCHPKGSAKQRLIARFELVRSVPTSRPA